MDLKNMTSEQLYKLAKEKELQEKRTRPEALCKFNNDVANKLIKFAEIYMKKEEEGDEIETQYAYEALMELVYGEKVWDYINSFALGE